MPIVSVIVPVYKAEKTIGACVDSILAQTFRDFELILVDDGSPDQSGIICDRLAKIDARIQVIHQSNGGVSSARNAGLDAASGDYVIFVDSDDRVYPDYVQRLYDASADLAICGLDVYHESGRLSYTVQQEARQFTNRESIDFAGLYKANTLYSPYCKLFRRDIIEARSIRFPIGISWGEDGMFVADYLVGAQSVCVLNYVGYRYIKYTGESSLSTQVRQGVIDMVCLSREYCIESIRRHAPWAYEQAAQVCQQDIRQNCADFVSMLLKSRRMNVWSKKKILKHFLKNDYVKQTLADPQVFYAPTIAQCMNKRTPGSILADYSRLCRRQRRQAAHQRVYDALPDWIKRIYSIVKG